MKIKKGRMFVSVSYPMRGEAKPIYFSKVFTNREFNDFEKKFGFKSSIPTKGTLNSDCYNNIHFYELGCLVETEKGIFNIKCKSKDAVRLMKENINECFS